MGGAYLHSPNTPSWRGVQFGVAQGHLYLYLCNNIKYVNKANQN